MDVNGYLVEWLAKERLGELRAALARQQLAASLREPSALRVRLGLALIRLGRRLQEVEPTSRERPLPRAISSRSRSLGR